MIKVTYLPYWLVIRRTSLVGAYFLLSTFLILVSNNTLLSACAEGAEMNHMANL